MYTLPTPDQYRELLYAAGKLYVSRGWPVIPLAPITVDDSGTKQIQPLLTWKDERGGPLTTVGAYDSWFTTMGHALGGLAIATGPAGVLGLDLDDYKGHGIELEPPAGAWVQHTARGGRHYFTANPTGERNTAGRMAGVDSRGVGGLIVMAPTLIRLADGTFGQYTTERPLLELPEPANLPPTPAALLSALSTSDQAIGATSENVPDWYREFAAQKGPQSKQAADRAITRVLEEAARHIPESETGFREKLMRAAYTLGGYVGGGYLTEHEAESRLYGVCNTVWGMTNDEDDRWIGQGLADGESRPFHVYDPAENVAVPNPGPAPVEGQPPAPAPRWTIHTAIGMHPFELDGGTTDQEMADAVLARMAPALRYAVDSGTWLVRGRDRWAEREGMEEWAIASVAELMPFGITPIPAAAADRTEDHWRAHWRARFMSSAGAGGIAKKVRARVRGTEHLASVELTDLDADPEVLWAGGWPFHLRYSGEVPTLAQLDLATPHTHTAAVAPDHRVPTPAWDHFLATVWPDPEIRAWALRVLSITLAGYPDAALPILYGPERTGKTATVKLIADLLGTYGHTADSRLLGGADNTHASIIYALKGRRLSFIDEGPRPGKWAMEALKRLTGGAALTGNAMRANPITFDPTHTLVLTANNEPPMTDPALAARLRVIPCDADREAVRHARAAITATVWAAEAPGVLAALMRECAAWLEDRHSASTAQAPEQLRVLATDIAHEQDPVRDWVQTSCREYEPGTKTSTLYRSFCEWHDSNPVHRRHTLPTMTAFGRSLNDQGYPVEHTRDGNVRKLEVASGPGGRAPWEPNHQPVKGLVKGCEGSETEPFTTDKPSSDPSIEPASEGLKGCSNTFTQAHTHKEYSQGNRSFSPTLHTLQPETGSDLGKPAVEGPFTEPFTGSEPLTVGRLRPVDVSGLAHDADGNPTQQLSKTLMNRSAKTLARRKAVSSASGVYVGLPAAVRRVPGQAPEVRPATPDEVESVLTAAVSRSGFLYLDAESTGYPIGHPDYALRTVQLGDATEAVVLPATPDWLATAARHLYAAPIVGAHSATADLAPLAHAGVIDYGLMWTKTVDTSVLAKLADPALTDNSADLKGTAAAILGEHALSPTAEAARKALFDAGKWKTDVDSAADPATKSGWAQADHECATMITYDASDVLDGAALLTALPKPEPHVLARERRIQAITARTTHPGIALDGPLVARLRAEHEAERVRIAEANTARWPEVKNSGSALQVKKQFHALGAAVPGTAKEVLEPLAKHPDTEVGQFAQAILAYRHEATLLSLLLNPWHVLAEKGDGRSRPTIYTLGADTGRMSCVRQNFQQVSKEGGIRPCVLADEGMVWAGADFSSVEVRVLAALSGDQQLISMLEQGLKLHNLIAEQVYGANPSISQYTRAKSAVFANFYGAGLDRIAATIGGSRDEAQRIRDAVAVVAPGVARWTEMVQTAVKNGSTQFPTYAGRIIHLDPTQPHKAVNYLIQGTARELLGDALIKWDDGPHGGGVVLPVHDEIIAMVREAEAQAALAYLLECMTSEISGVPILAAQSCELVRAWTPLDK